ncbi:MULTISPECIES: P22 phage major capsid protein family protein [Vibrio]|uniref:P22 phage major capsid protein family protein n=1 Tax=Vibrio TaxID=662 RepID=UPI00112485D8|nr:MULTISPECIES: P22 phage major capsid protein family protein [Vibrio]EHR5319610.1 hypothetical protein [Vibrio parahaemolyticus]MBH9742167.1 hypothetical protein [Vibrio navarrensis]MDF4582239.1 P22 phage major capsid protein family protein [Vibrio parahaemolyticus]TOA02985.1 hypothetical protein CGK35_15405 [Vibrio parahaemolyticus]
MNILNKKVLVMFGEGDNSISEVLEAFESGVSAFGVKAFHKKLSAVLAGTVDTSLVPMQKGEKTKIDMPVYFDDADDMDEDLDVACKNPKMTQLEVELDRHKGNKFKMNARELMAVREGTLPKILEAMSESLGRTINKDVATTVYKKVGLFSGDLESQNPRDFSDLASAEEVLNAAGVEDGFRLLMHPKTKTNLKISSTNGTKSGDEDLVSNGNLGNRNGFDLFPNISINHESGTASANAGIKVKTAVLEGATAMTLTGLVDGETIKDGDIFELADGSSYSIDGNYTVTGTDVTINLYQKVKAAIAADVTVDIKGSHRVDLAFHQSAYVTAFRPFKEHRGSDSFAVTVAHPESGIPITYRNWSKDAGTHNYWKDESLYTVSVIDLGRIVRMGGH